MFDLNNEVELAKNSMIKALGIPKSFMMPGATGLSASEIYNPAPIGVHSPYVVGCFRPLAMARRIQVGIEERHAYLWYSPCVPLGVKLKVACELADELVEQTRIASEPGQDMQNIKNMLDMIHESQQAFELGGIHAKTPKRKAKYERIAMSLVEYSPGLHQTSVQACLHELWRAFRLNLVDMGNTGTEEGMAGCRYSAYESLTRHFAEVSYTSAKGKDRWRGWQEQVTKTYGREYGPLVAMKPELDAENERCNELLQQRIDRIVELIQKT
jgi:hypothetical protein